MVGGQRANRCFNVIEFAAAVVKVFVICFFYAFFLLLLGRQVAWVAFNGCILNLISLFVIRVSRLDGYQGGGGRLYGYVSRLWVW